MRCVQLQRGLGDYQRSCKCQRAAAAITRTIRVFLEKCRPDIPRIVAHLVVMLEKLDSLDILVLVSELQHVLRPPEHREVLQAYWSAIADDTRGF